jgi:hypothetical protein
MITLTDLPTLTSARTGALVDTVRMALRNVEQYATARSVIVSAFALRDGVSITVSTDAAVAARHGIAGDEIDTVSISKRLTQDDGTVTINPNEDGGVTLHAWVPV